MRVYVIIACTTPLLVFYHHGYLRLSLQDYCLNEKSTDESERYTHLTNAFVQKKHPNFHLLKENTIWSMQKFEQYVLKNYKLTMDDINKLYVQIKKILCYTFTAGS